MTQAVDRPKIGALAPWFGGKRNLAPLVIEELGRHRAYWEPFCGSCAVLFAKGESAMETVNDLHGDLTNLLRVVASDGCFGLYERLLRTACVEALFDEAKGRIAVAGPGDEPDPDRAYWYFLVSWMGRNGTAGTRRINYQMAVRWTANGGHGPRRFASVVESLPWFHRRLRNVLVLRRDAFDVLGKIEDAPGTAVYVDPPYLMESRGWGRRDGRDGGSAYEHDLSAGDHERLRDALRRFLKSRVVVSYYDSPEVRALYEGWTVRQVYRMKNLHVQNRRGSSKTVAPELLILNGPSFAAADMKESGLFA